MKLIVGLGNPWPRYTDNRHNIWFVAVERLQELRDFPEMCLESKRHAAISRGEYHDETIILCQPLTYMNRSGWPVSQIAQFFKIAVEDILVIHDEIDLATATIKYKTGGGHAGHNGLRDIIARVWSRDFSRIRIGVDRPAHSDQVADYVLSNFTPDQKIAIDQHKEQILQHVIERI